MPVEDSVMKNELTSRVENPAVNSSSETELEEQLILAAIQTSEPVTVRLYGIKEITLPAYVLLLATTLIVVFGLIAAAAEVVLPRTASGEWAQRLVAHDAWILEAAIWAPPLLLVGLAFEVLECAVVMAAFRRNFQARDERIRQRLRSAS
jgi:hypothetical protein